jgi:hypothetical protein
LEVLDHLPIAQIFGCQLALAVHAPSKASWLNLYKLQLRDEVLRSVAILPEGQRGGHTGTDRPQSGYFAEHNWFL